MNSGDGFGRSKLCLCIKRPIPISVKFSPSFTRLVPLLQSQPKVAFACNIVVRPFARDYLTTRTITRRERYNSKKYFEIAANARALISNLIICGSTNVASSHRVPSFTIFRTWMMTLSRDPRSHVVQGEEISSEAPEIPRVHFLRLSESRGIMEEDTVDCV